MPLTKMIDTPLQSNSSIAYRAGEIQSQLGDQTVGACFAGIVARQPDALAMVSVHQGIRWTYAELAAEVERAALALMALGVDKGERVGVWSPSCVEWAVLQLATARLGAILVNVNPAYRPSELGYALRHSGVRMLVTAQVFKSSDYLAMIAEVRGALPALERVITLGDVCAARSGDLIWSEFMRRANEVDPADLHARESQLRATDPINIQYTSGTTGNPKGATLSHQNILNNAAAVADVLGYGPGDRVCIPVPLYHCFGMGIGNLGCIAAGASMVYPSASFEPLATLQAIEAERCTSLYGVPTMFIAQLEHPRFSEFDLSSLRT
jgi:fatty-acyl-CoA synthase